MSSNKKMRKKLKKKIEEILKAITNDVENRKIIDLINTLKSCLGFFLLFSLVNQVNKSLCNLIKGKRRESTSTKLRDVKGEITIERVFFFF